ncbi:MAG: restriction endonuclease [Planctomycetes bacterium]|nr:restriction endonuclease [Planctomycetota bacterium]
MSYDFSQLNDKEFEIIVTDLLSVVFNKRIERFKHGRDGGVDGRFYSDTNQEIIIQSKHYLKSGYKALLSTLRKEVIKIKKLKPERYILVSSLPLSRDNKKEIKNVLNPFVKMDNDIFGQEDLNDILSQNPKIEEKHFKLWFSSTTVFGILLHNAIKGRSEFEIEQIKKRTLKYVQTQNHSKAHEILKNNNVIIISGEPGIGKTTLAENLCLEYVANDYEFLDIEESLREAESVYIRGKKQIFYFDDFLGSNYFEAIENKKDSHIIKFIERIKNDNTKKFILTSRTNILNSGLLHSSIFSTQKIRKNEFLLTIDRLDNLEKARILYNHIWFSELNEDFMEEIYRDKRYHQIIKHENFNPRLIEFITDNDRLNVVSDEYWSYISKTLDNPKDIWNNCFKNQNNAFVRSLVILTVFNGSQITEEELRKSFNALIDIENLKNPSHTEKDFNSTAQLATKSFLSRNKSIYSHIYSLFNPSIADYILNEYNKDVRKLINIFKSLYTIKSLEMLISLGKSKIVSASDLVKILDALFTDAFPKDKTLDYLIFISHLYIDDAAKNDRIISFLRKIINKPQTIDEFSKFLCLLSKFEKKLKITNFDFLVGTFKDRYLDDNELKNLIIFFDDKPITSSKLLDELKEQINSYIYGRLEDIAADIDLSPYLNFNGYDDDVDVDEDSIFQYLTDSLLSEMKGVCPNLIGKFNLDIPVLASQVDIDNLVSNYLSSIQYESEWDKEYGSYRNFDNDIDDLFERT